MGLVKSAEAPIGLAAFSMKDIESAAKGILVRARAEAAQIVAIAKTEAEEIKKNAQIEGFAGGLRDGLAKGREEGSKAGHTKALADNSQAMTTLIQALTTAVKDLDERREDLHTAGLHEVVELACGIARRVTRRQASFDPQVLCNNLKDSMALAVHAADIRIALNPTQVQTLQKELPNLKLSWPQLKHVELVEDSQIAPGGVRIFTLHGQVDGRIETQLDRIATELIPEAASPQQSPAVNP
jgi:flagellar assembly protein FliH